METIGSNFRPGSVFALRDDWRVKIGVWGKD